MKSIKLSIVSLAIFSILLTIYFNPFSIAQESTKEELKVESEVYKQLEENDMVNIIIKLSRDSNSEDLDKIVKNSKDNIKKLSNEIKLKTGKLDIIYTYEAFNSLAVKADKETIEALKDSKFVEKIFAERMLEIQLLESTPLIKATQAWNTPVTATTNLTGLDSIVCLMDTGVDYNSPLLGGAWGVKIIEGYDFVNGDSNPLDDNGHGTHLAGIIAGKGMAGPQLIRGVAPDAYIVAEKVCDLTGGCLGTAILAGMNHCMTKIGIRRVSAISISIGDLQGHNSSTCPTWMDSAINTAVNFGVPVVVSSGNQGFKNGISYPACSPNATSVGATYDRNVTGGFITWNNAIGMPGNSCTDPIIVDTVACGSNSGPDLDLMAPGATIYSAATPLGLSGACGNSVNPISGCKGTSQSAAHVSGAVALIKQKYGHGGYLNNYAGWKRIENILKTSPKIVTDSANGLTFPRLSLERIL